MSRASNYCQKRLSQILVGNEEAMFLTYSNIKKAKENLHQVNRSVVLETEGIEGYVIKLNGDSFKDE